ncbi:MAG: class II aldolase/adducin family protein [Firmicutes bacterium]|nr:class II aldolase/adducin family protein [Bacillota bacterium]
MDERERRLAILREKVLEYSLRMSRSGMAPSTWGNISALDRGSGVVAITPSGMEYDSLTPSDICLLDLEGAAVEIGRKPSTETALHLAVYALKPEVGAVVHTHSVYATAFACARREIPVVNATLAAVVGGRVPVAPYAAPGTRELGLGAVNAMGGRPAVLLAAHGVLAVGSDLRAAYTVAEIVEDAARIACLAGMLGAQVELDAAETARIRTEYLRNYGQGE